ncbi:COG3650 family protein [Aquipseudomonas alcaligenes]|uniref:COG3650 family protein n=1 Tax=Aquipseudomonas alcaligenes TaxID=43263 RepID=UPI0037489854
MPDVRPLLFALLPLFAGCQLFSVYTPPSPTAAQQRLQGELRLQQGKLLLTPCGEQRQLEVINDGSNDIAREAAALFTDGNEQLFVDLRGTAGASKQAGLDGEIRPSQVYRLQGEGPACNEPGFNSLLLRASGHEPDWTLGVSEKGLVLLRPDQEALALPYVEEQLPGGSFNLSSEANGQRLELWLAPQRCVDSMSGAVQHLSAELRLNDKVLRGCASFGGARSQ